MTLSPFLETDKVFRDRSDIMGACFSGRGAVIRFLGRRRIKVYIFRVETGNNPGLAEGYRTFLLYRVVCQLLCSGDLGVPQGGYHSGG